MMLSQIINISNYAFHTLVTNREEAVRSEKPLHCSAVTQCPTPPGSAETHTHTHSVSLFSTSLLVPQRRPTPPLCRPSRQPPLVCPRDQALDSPQVSDTGSWVHTCIFVMFVFSRITQNELQLLQTTVTVVLFFFFLL